MTALDALCDQLSLHRHALALGGGHSVVAIGLRSRGALVEAVSGDWPSIQLLRRYPLVIVEPSDAAHDRAAVVHCAAQHVDPGGHVLLMSDEIDDVTERFDLHELARISVEGVAVALYGRTERFTIHDKVFAARSRIARVTALELATRLEQPDAPTIVDTRTATDRSRFGAIAGSIHVPRTVVEWHLDPANGYRHRAVTSFDQPLVLVCNGGYSSSLAAAMLLELGFTDVGDLVGGMRAWVDAGFEVVAPDHSHLDL